MHSGATLAPDLKTFSRDRERAASANAAWRGCAVVLLPFVVAARQYVEAMSDLSSTSGQAAPKEQLGMNLTVLMPMLWLAAAVAMAWPTINGGVFDAMATDDAMRLVQVRDLIGGQGWFDLFQHRLDPPGASMHWSRIIDLPLAALILLLRPLLGTHGAEAVTLFLYPLLLLATALALVAGIARQISGGGANAQIMAVVLAVLSAPALIHFRPGAIDHHNVQIVLLLAVVLLTSQIEQSAVKAALGGVAATLSLAIGIEMLPAIAATGLAVFGLLIWRGASVRGRSPPLGRRWRHHRYCSRRHCFHCRRWRCRSATLSVGRCCCCSPAAASA